MSSCSRGYRMSPTPDTTPTERFRRPPRCSSRRRRVPRTRAASVPPRRSPVLAACAFHSECPPMLVGAECGLLHCREPDRRISTTQLLVTPHTSLRIGGARWGGDHEQHVGGSRNWTADGGQHVAASALAHAAAGFRYHLGNRLPDPLRRGVP